MPRMIVMGRVIGPFGVKGWIKVQTFTEELDTLGGFREWWIGGGEDWRRVTVDNWEAHADHLVAKLAQYAQREEVAVLRGQEIAIPREQLQPVAEGEYYHADLVGAQVVNRAGERLGSIDRIFSNGAHDVMAVRGGESSDGAAKEATAATERLIPFIPQVVDKVDLAAGEVRVDWGADW